MTTYIFRTERNAYSVVRRLQDYYRNTLKEPEKGAAIKAVKINKRKVSFNGLDPGPLERIANEQGFSYKKISKLDYN